MEPSCAEIQCWLLKPYPQDLFVAMNRSFFSANNLFPVTISWFSFCISGGLSSVLRALFCCYFQELRYGSRFCPRPLPMLQT